MDKDFEIIEDYTNMSNYRDDNEILKMNNKCLTKSLKNLTNDYNNLKKDFSLIKDELSKCESDLYDMEVINFRLLDKIKLLENKNKIK